MGDKKSLLKELKNNFDIHKLNELIDSFKNLNVLVIGDTIIDHYVFVSPKGRAIKDPILSVEYKYHEPYAGGIIVIGNHISDFVKNIKVVTLLGDKNDKLNFITNSLNKNMELKTFTKKNSFTVVKKRFIDEYRNNKMFKIEYMDDDPIDKELTKEIVDYLDKELPKYDLVIIGDFGHGFINDEIRRKLEEKSKFLALNVQSNSANMGYNYFTLYNKFDFITLSESELRLPLLKRFDPIDDVIKETYKKYGFEQFLTTIGKEGCIFVKNGNIFKFPALTTTVKDTVGAGDALFALASLFVYKSCEEEFIPFIANCGGAIGANIMGNKESLTKEKLLDFTQELLK